MSRRVVIVHGWYGSPDEGWFPWLKRELEAREYEVQVPSMPNPETPEIEGWISELSNVVGTPADDLILIGHSIGCQTILRYLATLNPSVRIAGVVLVAPWAFLEGINAEERKIAEPWLNNIPPYPQVHRHVSSDNFYSIFSDDDVYVNLEDNSEFFKNRYGSKIIIENSKGHMGGDDGITELPSALEAVINIATK